jgi:imidazolonepropionase-like amidohydrolase
MFYEIIKQAEHRGLKTTGHMPMDGDIREAYDYGLDGSEHMYYILKACAEIPDSVRDLNLGYGVLSYVLENYDDTIAEKTFEKLASRPFFVTPTLYIGKTLSELADADHSGDSTLTYIGEGIQKTYDRRLQQAIRAKESGNNSRGAVNKQFRKMIRPMYDAGIFIMAGSDCGASNSFVYPGQSLIGELQQLVAAGLTPQEALTTSIINGPKFFDVSDYYGSVSSGKIANLLILRNNPLEDIDNVLTKEFVVQGGRLIK